MANNTVDVFWTVKPSSQHPMELPMLMLDPEPALPHIMSGRAKNTEYLRCPAFAEFFKNTYVVRSPIDLEFHVNKDGFLESAGTPDWMLGSFACLSGSRDIDTYITYQLDMTPYVFFSKKRVRIQQLPAFMEPEGFLRNVRPVVGIFDISKWFRPLSFGFEVADTSVPIIIKRGDPLFYVKFHADNDAKVVLTNKPLTADVRELVESCVSVKRMLPSRSLRANYDIAALAVKRFWWGRRDV